MTDPATTLEQRNWLTVAEVCAAYNMSKSAAYRRIPEWKRHGIVSKMGRTLVNRTRLEDWLEKGGELCASDGTCANTSARRTTTTSSRRTARQSRTGDPPPSAGSETQKTSQSDKPSRLKLRLIQ